MIQMSHPNERWLDAWPPDLVQRVQLLDKNIIELLGPKAKKGSRTVMGDVLLAATQYLELSKHYDEAPTRNKLRKKLELLRDNAGTVAGMLESGEPHLLAALTMHGAPQDEIEARSQTLNVLWNLCVSAHAAIFNLELDGPASGQKAATWPPKRALAYHCYEIFNRYRPGEASSTAGGNFQEFVGYVYEVARGQGDADLETPIKQVLALVREQNLPASENPFDLAGPFLRDLEKLRRP